jgi:hypothetical protein
MHAAKKLTNSLLTLCVKVNKSIQRKNKIYNIYACVKETVKKRTNLFICLIGTQAT